MKTRMDYNGNTLSMWEDVVYVPTGRYKSICTGTVIGFTPQMIRIKDDRTGQSCLRESHQVVLRGGGES